jgi:2-polyprenyl-6-methoxyphenol hydroxylase-like FAD-dependent oxidoreductase
MIVDPRTLEIWHDQGVACDDVKAGFCSRGHPVHVRHGANGVWLEGRGGDDPGAVEPGARLMVLPPRDVEVLLSRRLAALADPEIERGAVVEDLQFTALAVAARIARPGVESELVSARYAVGCDGGGSVVRRRCAISFDGCDGNEDFLLAEVCCDLGLAPNAAPSAEPYVRPAGSPRALGHMTAQSTSCRDRLTLPRGGWRAHPRPITTAGHRRHDVGRKGQRHRQESGGPRCMQLWSA